MDAKYAGKTQKELTVEILLAQVGMKGQLNTVQREVQNLDKNLGEFKTKVYKDIDDLNDFKSKQEGKQEGIKETKVTNRKMWMLVIAALAIVVTIVISIIKFN